MFPLPTRAFLAMIKQLHGFSIYLYQLDWIMSKFDDTTCPDALEMAESFHAAISNLSDGETVRAGGWNDYCVYIAKAGTRCGPCERVTSPTTPLASLRAAWTHARRHRT
eukprot:m.153970 g.153970  ORF g.153970 m.153970 type:complete len:109 (-) comp11712_c0_seq24:149-475(-)